MVKLDKLYFNGNFKNFSGDNYKYLGVEDGKIKVLGYDVKECKEFLSDEIIDLKGKLVLPGFFDSHVHLLVTAINEITIDLSAATDFTYLESEIKKHRQNESKDIITGFSMHYFTFAEKRLPTRRELDKMCNDRPIWLASRDWHVSVVNSKALEVLRIPLSFQGIEFDEKGIITGKLTDDANAYARKRVMDKYDFKSRCELINDLVQNKIIKQGVTSLVAIDDSMIRDIGNFKKMQKFFKTLPIDIDLYCNTTDVSLALENKLSRIGGDILLDGSFTSRNAALMENYSDTKTRGNLYFSQDELNRYLEECYKYKLQTGLHAVGDRSLEQALVAHEHASKLYPNTKLRHRIEHGELASDEQLDRASKLNLIFSMQPAFETLWGHENGMYTVALGDRHKKTNRFRIMVDKGIIICGGSDSILTEINPIRGIYSAVNHPQKEHRLTVDEAIRMFTINAAYGVGEEEQRGSLALGKKADMVVLDKDIESIDSSKIDEAVVLMTIKDGHIIYKNRKGAVANG